jgi:hypothetical protein
MMAVDIETNPNFVAGRPRKLFEHNYVTTGPARSYDVTPDGRRFLMVKPHPYVEEPIRHIHIVLNWLEELKHLVPNN